MYGGVISVDAGRTSRRRGMMPSEPQGPDSSPRPISGNTAFPTRVTHPQSPPRPPLSARPPVTSDLCNASSSRVGLAVRRLQAQLVPPAAAPGGSCRFNADRLNSQLAEGVWPGCPALLARCRDDRDELQAFPFAGRLPEAPMTIYQRRVSCRGRPTDSSVDCGRADRQRLRRS